MIQTRESALGCFIPFSMPDGNTPFRVFLFKNDKMKETDSPKIVVAPDEERWIRGEPFRLFLFSKTGFLTNPLFKIVMEHFSKWWTTTRPGLHCFMLSDNLKIHRSVDIVRMARDKGIHLLNIMVGSSHWFQVHDQLPFAMLKKTMKDQKYQCVRSISLPPQERRDLLMCMFYEAETKAFEPHLLRESFATVGLWPWMPSIILKNAEEFSPVIPQSNRDDMVNDLATKIIMQEEQKEARVKELLATRKRERVLPSHFSKIRERPGENGAPKEDGGGEEDAPSSGSTSMDVSLESPSKRPKKAFVSHAVCGASGCENRLFWSKKWVFCPKCNIHFCPSHADEIQKHKC